MKKNLKFMLAGLVIGASVSTVIPAMGYDGVRNIQAVFKNIKICVDGVEMTPRDAAGKEVEPFIYNGTTYLPVKAVGEAVGKEVSYDGNTNTVYLGKSGQVKYLGQQVKMYQGNDARECTVTMGGNNYTNGLSIFHKGNAYYNLNGLYNSISGVYGMADGKENYKGVLNFYGDGRLLKSITVEGSHLPKNFAVDVSGVAQLKIEIDSAYAQICLGSVEFK